MPLMVAAATLCMLPMIHLTLQGVHLWACMQTNQMHALTVGLSTHLQILGCWQGGLGPLLSSVMRSECWAYN